MQACQGLQIRSSPLMTLHLFSSLCIEGTKPGVKRISGCRDIVLLSQSLLTLNAHLSGIAIQVKAANKTTLLFLTLHREHEIRGQSDQRRWRCRLVISKALTHLPGIANQVKSANGTTLFSLALYRGDKTPSQTDKPLWSTRV